MVTFPEEIRNGELHFMCSEYCLDQGLVFGVSLTNLLKAFECFSHELLAAKVNAYGLEIQSSV